MQVHDAVTASKENTSNIQPKPFVKWVGGKSQIIQEITTRLPRTFTRYYEPFVGGGALFFHLQPKKACLSDINDELINVYNVVKNDVEALIKDLSKHVYEEAYFYNIREADRSPSYKHWGTVRKASRFMYLNKTCYNGLYRVNSKGYFNTPFGSYQNPKICDPENLRLCSQALQGVEICCSSYHLVEERSKPGDFVYFDPPYAPLTVTSNFTSYSKDGFGKEDQEELRNLCLRLDHKGVQWMVSNSSAPLILDLYKNYNLEMISASRAINSKGTLRGKVKEVIIRNYA
jgi:DNA adenine methylase